MGKSFLSQEIVWNRVTEKGALPVMESVIECEDNEHLTVHAVVLLTDELTLDCAVNRVGQDYCWKEEIVRGMIQWDQGHMVHMNDILRKTPIEYYKESLDQDNICALLNGNGNLYWNLGHFVFTNKQLFHHFREKFDGIQIALIKDHKGIRIGAMDLNSIGSEIEFAVSGNLILRNGLSVDLLSINPETNRPALSDYYGDISHILKGFRLSLSLSRILFKEASTETQLSGRTYYTKSNQQSELLNDAVCGYPITFELSHDENLDEIHERMQLYGYEKVLWGEHLSPGSFTIKSDKVVAVALRRSTLGHSLILTTEDPNLLLYVNVYTNPGRKGFTIDNLGWMMKRIGSSMRHQVRDALIISSSGDPRIVLHQNGQLNCLEKNLYGDLLLFKGGLAYGLSNMLMVRKRR